MKLKDRIKTYNFWVSLSSAIFLFLKVIGNQVGFKVSETMFSDLITSLCGILVILGIIVPPSYKTVETQNSSTTKPTDSKSSHDETETDMNVTLEDASINQKNNEQFNSESNETMFSQNKVCDNVEDVIIEENLEKQDDFVNIEELKSQVSKTLANQEKLLNGYSDLYIELLQTQINNMLNK